jgi:hypothetical protein
MLVVPYEMLPAQFVVLTAPFALLLQEIIEGMEAPNATAELSLRN